MSSLQNKWYARLILEVPRLPRLLQAFSIVLLLIQVPGTPVRGRIMRRFQISLAWLSVFLLVTANVELEGCSSKETSPAAAQPAPVVSQAAGQAPAPEQATSSGNAQSDQT